MARDEQAIEAEIQAKGLNAPRLNPAHIDAQIIKEMYHVFDDTTLTVCALTLKNGFKSSARVPQHRRRTSTPISARRSRETMRGTRSGRSKATCCAHG